MLDLEDGDDEWEVEDLKDRQQIDGEPYYLVKWKGWLLEYNQWVVRSDIKNA